MNAKQIPIDYSIDFNEPDEITLTFINQDTKETQKATVHIKDPTERAKFLGLIKFPLEEFQFGLYGETVTPQNIIDVTLSQIKLQSNSKSHKEYPKTIYFESPSTQSFFQRDGEGNYITYHWEGGETYETAGKVPLTLETLSNERPLFLCPNKDEWDPKHLEDRDSYSLYEIKIKPIDLVHYKVFDAYCSLLKFDSELNQFKETNYLKGLKSASFRLFVLGENDKDELKEAFLVTPLKYVLSIKKLNKDENNG